MASSRSSHDERTGAGGALGFSGMNLNEDGSVMTKEQIISLRKSGGFCVSCSNEPTQCFLVKRNKFNPLIRTTIPLTVDGVVFEGNCLSCHPEMDPNRKKRQKEWHRRSRRKLLGTKSRPRHRASHPSVPDPIAEDAETDTQAAAVSFSSGSLSTRSAPPSPSRAFDASPGAHVTGGRRGQLVGSRAASTSQIDTYRRTVSLDCSSRTSPTTDQNRECTASEDNAGDHSVPRPSQHGPSNSLPDFPDIFGLDLPVARAVSKDEEDASSIESASVCSDSWLDPKSSHDGDESQTRNDQSEASEAELKELVLDLMKQGAKDCAVDVVATAIMETPDCVELVRFGIWVLWKLSRESKKLKERIIYSSGLDAIVQGMASCLSDPKIQEKGCGTIWSLAVEEKNHANIAAAGGCTRVLDALSTHVEAVDVVARALGAVRAMSSGCKDSRLALETRCAAQTVACAMKVNLSSEQIQAEGCLALCNLAVDPSSAEVSVCSAEEIDAVAAALAAHPSSVEVQFGGCTALRNYVSASINIQAVSSCCLPVEKLLETAKEQFPYECGHHVNEVLKSLSSRPVDVSLSLEPEESREANDGSDVATGNCLNDVSSIDDIISAMFDDTSCLKKQVKGLQDMCSLCRKGEEDCEKVADSLALDVIATIMTVHESQERIQENALYVLWEIASSSAAKNKIRIVRSGVCSCIVNAMTVHKTESIQKMAMAIISVLSEDEKCREALKQSVV